MSYAQWISIRISPANVVVSIKDAKLSWGKFYKTGDKDVEIPDSTINKITINSGDSTDINSCGRSDASSGTEGEITIKDGDTTIGVLQWDCPWGSKTNKVHFLNEHSEYDVSLNPSGNLHSGAIGTVGINITKKD